MGRSPRIRSCYEIGLGGPVNRYYFTRKKQVSFGVSQEEEKEITFKSFNNYLKRVDSKKKVIEKTRYYIPWDGNVFELDIFHGFNEGLIMLEVELSDINEKFQMPRHFRKYTDVTHDKSYSNKSLATKSKGSKR